MNLYDKASLVITPNACKAGKVYAVKPTDGSGDSGHSRDGKAWLKNSVGLWEEVPANVRRLHYPVGGGCPTWLDEPQQTNLLKRITAANWSITNATQQNLTSVSPSTVNDATLFYEDAVTAFDHYYAMTGFLYNGVYTFSVRVKGVGREYFQVAMVSDVLQRCIFKTSDNTVVDAAGLTCSIEAEGNGYSNITISGTFANLNQIALIPQIAATYQSYLGDVTKGYYLWNVKLVTGLYAGTPIITDNSAVTRLADVPQVVSTPLVLNDFTVFIEFKLYAIQPVGCMLFGSQDLSNNSNIYLDSALNLEFSASGGLTTIGASGVTTNTRQKIAIKRSGNQLKYFRNGQIVATATVSTNSFKLASFATAGDGSGNVTQYVIQGETGECLAYTTAKTDAECVAITTL